MLDAGAELFAKMGVTATPREDFSMETLSVDSSRSSQGQSSVCVVATESSTGKSASGSTVKSEESEQPIIGSSIPSLQPPPTLPSTMDAGFSTDDDSDASEEEEQQEKQEEQEKEEGSGGGR
jgi:hypothetical protein